MSSYRADGCSWQNRFIQQPETYKQFLDILQTYQRESKPIQDVYAQVTQLFHTAPDLLEDFKQFLPESAAQAKAQAAARAAADEAMISNIRADYATGQIAQAQTPRPTTKMPPMGQFDPPSTSKENKKRRGGFAVQPPTQPGPSSSTDITGTGQSGRGAPVQFSSVKVGDRCFHRISFIYSSNALLPSYFKRAKRLRSALSEFTFSTPSLSFEPIPAA